MTAVNIILQKQQALIMMDTVAYSPTDGIPHSFHRKCVPAPGRTVAVCSRGEVNLTNAFAQAFPEFYAGIDDAVADEFSYLRQVYEIHFENSGVVGRMDACEVLFVGWSEKDQAPIGKAIVRQGGAWDLVNIDPDIGIHAPGLEGQVMEEFSRQPEVEALDWSREAFNPRKHGILLMEAQRRQKFTIAGLNLPPMHLIGGAIQLTTLTRRGVVEEFIHDWQDPLGVPIKPKPYAQPSSAPSGLNRQQRRAWERRHGKVAA